MYGASARDPDQSIDDRRHAGEQPDDRLQRAPHRRRGELGQEDRRQRLRPPARSNTAGTVVTIRPPDQWPGSEVERGVPRQRACLRPSRAAGVSTFPPGPNQLSPLPKGRPRLDEDRDCHRGDQDERRDRERAEHLLGAPVTAAGAGAACAI